MNTNKFLIDDELANICGGATAIEYGLLNSAQQVIDLFKTLGMNVSDLRGSGTTMGDVMKYVNSL